MVSDYDLISLFLQREDKGQKNEWLGHASSHHGLMQVNGTEHSNARPERFLQLCLPELHYGGCFNISEPLQLFSPAS